MLLQLSLAPAVCMLLLGVDAFVSCFYCCYRFVVVVVAAAAAAVSFVAAAVAALLLQHGRSICCLCRRGVRLRFRCLRC